MFEQQSPRGLKDPSDCSLTQLEKLVRQIQAALWVEWSGTEPVCNPEKDWSADTLETIANALDHFGLAPK